MMNFYYCPILGLRYMYVETHAISLNIDALPQNVNINQLINECRKHQISIVDKFTTTDNTAKLKTIEKRTINLIHNEF